VGGIITTGGLGVKLNANVGGTFGVKGNTAITGTLDVTGDTTLGALSATSISETSDRRLKNNIGTLVDALSIVRRLRGVRFSWHNSTAKQLPNGKQTGFIAQEVESVIPDSVRTDKGGWKSVAYTTIIPYVIEGVKEMHLEIESQSKQIDDQSKQIDELSKKDEAHSKQIDELQQQVDKLTAAIQNFIAL
jgi:hypothetical protein